MTITGLTRTTDRNVADQGAAVRVRGLSKVFGRRTVLSDIWLDAVPDEFVCLVGASGCGKTTLLYMIAGLGRPTAGSVEVTGARPALMFQESALLPWLTAARNVEFALRLRGVPRRERTTRTRELLELVRLGDAADARPHQLSGGMRQRVALARALAQDSDVLLMDEPFASLDAITRDVLHDELVRVWQRTGRTVLFVTHNVREAAVLGQRIVLLGSRPGVVRREWTVDLPQPRRIESPAVTALAAEITAELRKEIARGDRD
jgi:NitT/TauT family transport system ATP-binding protein